MPAYVLKCEGCAQYGSFLVHEGELEASNKDPIQRYCPSCHKTSNWTMALPERRGGHERRTGLDRRAAGQEPIR